MDMPAIPLERILCEKCGRQLVKGRVFYTGTYKFIPDGAGGRRKQGIILMYAECHGERCEVTLSYADAANENNIIRLFAPEETKSLPGEPERLALPQGGDVIDV